MQRLRAFMQGRYGVDQLSMALILLGCLITLVLSLLRFPFFWTDFYRYRLQQLPGAVPLLIAAWRVLSRKVEKRRQENERFLKAFGPFLETCKTRFAHWQDHDHRYFACPTCKRTLRVPKNRGKIEITCPHCGTKFKRRT